MVIIVLLVLGLFVVVGGAALGRRRQTRASRAVAEVPEAPAHPLDLRPTVRGSGQVLFVEPEGHSLRVDCVLVGEHTEGASPGSLLTFRLFPPHKPALATPFEELLARWAHLVQVVDLELLPRPDGWRLQMDDGDFHLNLEIRQPARAL